MLFNHKSSKNPPVLKPVDICLLVDNSISLEDHIDDINSAVEEMIDGIKTSNVFKGLDVYFTFITFSDKMQILMDFEPINEIHHKKIVISKNYSTNPAPALDYAVRTAMRRYNTNRDNGLQPYKPVFYFFTDGIPYPAISMTRLSEEGPEMTYAAAFEQEAALIKGYITQRSPKLLFICAGFGKDADIDNLKKLTDESFIINMREGNTDDLKRFFNQLIPQTPCTNDPYASAKDLIDLQFRMPGQADNNSREK